MYIVYCGKITVYSILMFSALKFFNNQIKENGWGFYMIEDCFEIIEYCRLLHKLVYTKRSPTDWFIDQKKIMNE